MKTILLLCAFALLSHSAHAASIGINLGAGGNNTDPLSASDSAGVVPQVNWNNTTNTSGNNLSLVDDTGSASGATVSWAADEEWGNGNPVEPNGTLLSSFFSDNDGGNSTIDISGIPYSSYDLYIYTNHDRVLEDTVLSENNAAFPTFTMIETDNDNGASENLQTPVTFTQQTTSGAGSGNYVLFSGLTASSLEIEFGVGNGSRSGMSGIQIVAATLISGLPEVTNITPTAITPTSATIRADLIDNGDGAEVASLNFYWGTTDAGNVIANWSNNTSAGTRSSPGAFSSTLTGLTPNTQYFYRAFATNSVGDDLAPESESFTTPPALPTVANLAASDVLGTSATIGGTITSTGGEVPTLVIHYGDDDAGTGNWDSQLDLGVQTGTASGQITALTPGTTYFFRAAATNSAGTAWATTSANFATTQVNPPSIVNTAATGINGTFATLNGNVTDTGGDPPLVTIFYGTTDGGDTPGDWDLSLSAGNQDGTFSRLATNLQPTTTYFFRARAQNVAGTVWASPSLTFDTPEFTAPTIVINEIHYDEDDKTLRAEFIELHNPSSDAVDLSQYSFSDGIDFAFPAGSTLAAGGYAVIAEDPAIMASEFGVAGAYGPFANGSSLKNSGEKITLVDPAGTTVDEVSYSLGFPWPTVGDEVGNPPTSPSIELISPLLDNDLAGSWRASGFPVADSGSTGGDGQTFYIANSAEWKYFADGTDQGTAWRTTAFDDSSWPSGPAELGYGDNDEATLIPSGGNTSRYATSYFRNSVNIPNPSAFVNFSISITYDDAYAIYVNGNEVARHAGLTANAPFDEYASNTVGNNAIDDLVIPTSAFATGDNVIAVEVHQSAPNSSDVSFSLALAGEVSGGNGGGFSPTPGAPNRSATLIAPPQVRQVQHSPEQPTSNQPVLITAKITDPDGVASVSLRFQAIDPGDYYGRYLKFNENGSANPDPRYEDPANWGFISIRDDGTGGDVLAGDSIYTATMPQALQIDRRLIRYRITARDIHGTEITTPYADDPQPNFAYFVYDGTPDWTGRIRTSDSNPVTYPGSLMSSISTYFLLTKNSSVEDSQFGGYRGSEYLWPGTMVYDGKVYDHIQYRPRGGVHRFQYGKNFWKFDFNRGHRFKARDRYGRRYETEWDKLNFSSIVQQVNFGHRGEQGLFEGVGFRLFELCGVPACETHYNQFYVIDQTSPTGSDQYEGDYYGLYLSIEQMDGKYLDQHGLPDGNLYKIEGNSGDSNNQGPTQVSDRSDVNAFISTSNGNPSAQWWEDNFEVENYFSYRTVVEAIHHYDIAGGKNFFYYHNPENDKFQLLPWDLDLTWANNMFGSGNHPFKSRVAENPAFNTGYQNRVREIIDLIYNTDEGYRLIDESVRHVWTPGQPSLVGADRRLWDNNPRLVSKDRYYDIANDNEFSGMIQVLKDYIVSRGAWMTSNLLTDEANIPDTPTITFSGTAGHPSNDLQFTSSSYSGTTGFAAMEWRISEIYNPTTSNYIAGEPYIYEIEDPTQSGALTTFDATYLFPALAARPGQTYRARVRHQDTAGRWSHWSQPQEFLVSAPDVTQYINALRITEVHYHPSNANAAEQVMGWEDDDFEFIELQNIGATTIDLTDVRFTKGADFDFAPGTAILPGAYAVIVKNQTAFESRYGTGLPVAGEWDPTDKLSNGGENIKLSLGSGTGIVDFTYDDTAPWPTAPDGSSYSLTLNCPDQTTPTDHTDPQAWRASRQPGGSPGTDDHLDFQTWATENNLGAAPSLTADPDQDGLSNLLEFALATDPNTTSTHQLPVAAHQQIGGENYLTITFTSQRAAKDLSYTIQTSTDLTSWQDSTAVQTATTPNPDGTDTQTWRTPTPTDTTPRQFIRLKVES